MADLAERVACQRRAQDLLYSRFPALQRENRTLHDLEDAVLALSHPPEINPIISRDLVPPEVSVSTNPTAPELDTESLGRPSSLKPLKMRRKVMLKPVKRTGKTPIEKPAVCATGLTLSSSMEVDRKTGDSIKSINVEYANIDIKGQTTSPKKKNESVELKIDAKRRSLTQKEGKFTPSAKIHTKSWCLGNDLVTHSSILRELSDGYLGLLNERYTPGLKPKCGGTERDNEGGGDTAPSPLLKAAVLVKDLAGNDFERGIRLAFQAFKWFLQRASEAFLWILNDDIDTNRMVTLFRAITLTSHLNYLHDACTILNPESLPQVTDAEKVTWDAAVLRARVLEGWGCSFTVHMNGVWGKLISKKTFLLEKSPKISSHLEICIKQILDPLVQHCLAVDSKFIGWISQRCVEILLESMLRFTLESGIKVNKQGAWLIHNDINSLKQWFNRQKNSKIYYEGIHEVERARHVATVLLNAEKFHKYLRNFERSPRSAPSDPTFEVISPRVAGLPDLKPDEVVNKLPGIKSWMRLASTKFGRAFHDFYDKESALDSKVT